MATTALKEWAVAVKLLREGRQTLLVRKGGIREENRHFKIVADKFLFFPTYEHQRADLLQPAYRSDLEGVLAAAPAPGTVDIGTYAHVTDVFEVSEPWQVEALLPFYCWSLGYAEERLRWKPRQPLLVMAIRAYRLAAPRLLDVLPAYGGCKSWLELAEDCSTEGMIPALTDAEYTARITEVRKALARQPLGV
ncbi:MAG: DUF1802 family protein [Chloroflexota bacterium]